MAKELKVRLAELSKKVTDLQAERDALFAQYNQVRMALAAKDRELTMAQGAEEELASLSAQE